MVALTCFLLTAGISTYLPLEIQMSSDELSTQAGHLESEKDWAGAAQVWEKFAAQNPTQPLYPLNAGNDWYKAKEYLKAIPDFEKADELGVSYKWDMPYSIACCYALVGDKNQALKRLKDAIDLGYRDLEQVRQDPDLASLHDDSEFKKLAATEDVSKMNRTAGYRYDLWFLNRELMRLHYDPFRRHSKAEFEKFVKDLDRDIPKLSDNQIGVRFKELAVMTGDGHTHLQTPSERSSAKAGLPVFFSIFKEGLFITRASGKHTDIVGDQVLSIDGHSIEELEKAVVPICSYDNTMWITARQPDFLRIPALLNGLGLTRNVDKATLKLRNKDGEVRDVTLQANGDPSDGSWVFARDLSKNPLPLTFQHRDKNYWFDQLPDSKTVYFQYNAVADMEDESIKKFADRLFIYLDEHDIDRLIIDARWNGGGNNFLNKPILEGLIKSKVNAKGNLFVIVGRYTFSAAMCFVTQVERYTNAIFAGEPTGSSPNFIGESIPITLPYSHMTGTVSDLYWQNSVAMDHRVWIAPTIYVPWSFADYSTNSDPVIDLIRNYKVEQPASPVR